MALSDPDLLDIVRKLRQNMSSLDNIHTIATALSGISDKAVVDGVYVLIPKLHLLAQDISAVLKLAESCKQYRDLVRKYGLEENND